MLAQLYVKNLAVVEHADIHFGPGLTVVTGETGAGKSLLVDALMLLSGARADASLVRAGSDRAELVAEFVLGNADAARTWLVDEALDDGEQCHVRRVIAAAGGSRAWINGRPVTLAQLAGLTSLLVEIHGQHEHQTLTHRQQQLALLDAYADNAATLSTLATLSRHVRDIDARRLALGAGDDREARLQLLRHEAEALQRWALPAEALQSLETEHKRLAHSERLLQGSAAMVEAFDGDSEFALRRMLTRQRDELARLNELDPTLSAALELIDSAQIQLDEAADSLGRYAQDQELEPERLAEIETHLTQLHDLARRHRVPLEALHDKSQQLQSELALLEGADAELESLRAERAKTLRSYAKAAAELSQRRADSASNMGVQVSTLMQELGMHGGRFAVELTPPQAASEADPQGGERCEFMVSANPGQPLRALRKVASGGELSRISLAIEVAALGFDTIGSMVFDEVDSGIGGAVAEVV
ncbi:MAG: DNA repair protein RecN, partial [Xanthomonadales bacterium]|nr:DNA repair protein RecN [Xanthomonadales bacterium]